MTAYMYLIEFAPAWGIAPEVYVPEPNMGRQEIANAITWRVNDELRGKGHWAELVTSGPVGFFHTPIYAVTGDTARHVASVRKIDVFAAWEE